MEPKKIHFVGIGGAGVSAVAAFAKNAGFRISGCDVDLSSQFLSSLKEADVNIFDGHAPDHLESVDLVVASPAIESLDPNNLEITEARKRNIPVIIGEKFLADYILKNKKVIAVSGTHGKSTTTAMIGKILEDAGLDPSVLVGAVVSDWGRNYRLGKGEYFVLEADEYQEKFLLYLPYITVVTAVEMDHPEFFKDIAAVRQAFEGFANQTKYCLVLGKNIEFRIQNSELQIMKFGTDFEQKNFSLRLIGSFNQDNATLAFEVGKLVGIDEIEIKNSLEKFIGVGRRFELKGEAKGVKVFDDYAHHPTAIRLTAQAAREKFPNEKIWLVYQPHMFSRTKYLERDFVETFKSLPTDEVILVDIFAARQENKEEISSKDIVDQVAKASVHYIGDFENTTEYLVKSLHSGDVVIMMGAGDIYKFSKFLLDRLKTN